MCIDYIYAVQTSFPNTRFRHYVARGYRTDVFEMKFPDHMS